MITWAFGLVGSALCILCVYYLVELLLRAHVSHTHAWKGEKLARAFFLLHACCTLWLSSRRAREWLGAGKDKEESKEKTIGRVGRARGCSWAAHLVVRRRSSPARAHGRIWYTRGKWSESRQVSDELSVLPRKSNPACLFIGRDAGCATSLLSVSFHMQQWCWEDGGLWWAVQRVAGDSEFLHAWPVPNFAWWSACMRVCVCACY
jgi:hypothetical protein